LKNVIVIGQMGSGKDTIAETLTKVYGYHHTSIAGRLKKIASLLYPREFSVKNRNAQRIILQQLGDLLRTRSINIFNDALFHEIDTANLGPVVISDVRYMMEFEYFINRGFIPVKININEEVRMQRLFNRDGQLPSMQARMHKSENEFDDMVCYIVNNTGDLKELEDSIIDFAEKKLDARKSDAFQLPNKLVGQSNLGIA
jgi:dephospho-CoA kinase